MSLALHRLSSCLSSPNELPKGGHSGLNTDEVRAPSYPQWKSWVGPLDCGHIGRP